MMSGFGRMLKSMLLVRFSNSDCIQATQTEELTSQNQPAIRLQKFMVIHTFYGPVG